MKFIRSIFVTGAFSLLLSSTFFAQQNGSIGGQVVDSLGAVIVGANVTAVSGDGKEKSATTNQRGEFVIAGLAPGSYILRVIAPKFALFENPQVGVKAGQRAEVNVALTVEGVREQVEVGNDNQVSTDPNSSTGATVLKEKDLEALPDEIGRASCRERV